MKVKLLKKVRKRFSIIYYPKGRKLWSGHYDTPILVLLDNEDNEIISHVHIDYKQTYDMSYEHLYQRLKETIIVKYRKYGTRRIKTKIVVKKWYK